MEPFIGDIKSFTESAKKERREAQLIPKTIHYFWFGRGKKSDLSTKCIQSWRKFCPDYEIIEWNEDNFDIGLNAYTKMCYEEKKFAFLSDYARLVILEEHGGFYFDTDVELVRPIDDLREHKAFIGFETNEYVNTGEGCGSEAHNPAFQAMLSEYDILLSGTQGTQGCPILNTQALIKLGMIPNGTLQNLEDIVIYPAKFFNPYDDAVGKLRLASETYSIHWYAKSWMKRSTIIRSNLSKPFHRLMRSLNKKDENNT